MPARNAVARAALFGALTLAICLPLGWTTTRSFRDVARARHALATEDLAARDARTISALVFDLARLRVALVAPALERERVPSLERRIAGDIARIRRGVAGRLPASDCPRFRDWSHRYERFVATPAARDAPDASVLIGDLGCHTFEISTASPLSADPDVVVQDLTSIGAMSVPGIAGHLAVTMTAFDRAVTHGRLADTLATARSLGYVTRNRENLDGAVAEIGRSWPEGSATLARRAAAASASERRFERRLVAALDGPSRSAARVTASERDALATSEYERSLGEESYDGLARRADAARHDLDARARVALVVAVVGFVFAVALVALVARLAAAYHARRLRFVENELARAHAERSLSLTEDQLRAVFESADAGIAIFDGVAPAVRANATYEALRARAPALDAVVRERVAALFAGALRHARDERTLADSDARELHADVSLASVYEGTTCRYAIVTVDDVTEIVELRERLRAEALRDGLTGLANRRAFERALGGAPRGRGYAIVYVDLDRFKPINDRYGHAAGDAVLGVVAERLAATVKRDDLVARLGGDEFAVIAGDVDDADDAGAIAARIIAAIEEPIVLAAATVTISASVGIALANDADATPESTLARADAAMYDAKVRRGTYRIAAVESAAASSS